MVLWDFGQMDGFSGRGRDMLAELQTWESVVERV